MKRLMFAILLLLVAYAAFAQDPVPPTPGKFNRIGRTAVGFHGAANMWMNNFDKRMFTGGADVFVRHHITRVFSLGLLGEYTNLQTNNSTISPTLAGLNHAYMKAEGFSANVVGWLNFCPGQTFSPYVYAGVGQFWYDRTAESEAGVPDNLTKNSINIPVGVGGEWAFSKAGALTFEVGARVMDNKTDFVTTGGTKTLFGTDWYPTARVGVALYIGDSDDDDSDGDGLTNGYEKSIGTDPHKADSDGDGLNDYEEVVKYHTDPLKADSDGDGLKDGDEVITYHTSPLEKDTDHDGLTDGEEVTQFRTDPLKADTDGDGLTDSEEVRTTKTDPLKADTDGDGLNDGAEVKTHKTNPLKADTDGGSVNDGAEVARGTNPLDPADDVPKPAAPKVEVGKAIVLEGIVFQTSKAIIEPQSEQTLNQALQVLTENPEIAVEVRGYTDNVGKAAANVKLSQRRADAVKAWLVGKGIDAARIGSKGMGAANPIAENTTPEGRAKNRRIEFFRTK